jgi:hypothetical protein
MNRSALIAIASVSVSTFLVGRYWGDHSHKTQAQVTSPNANAPKAVVITPPPHEAAHSLVILNESLDKRQRILALIDQTSSPAELAQLLETFHGDTSAEAAVALRWATLDSPGFLTYLQQRPHSVFDPSFHLHRTLFRVWAERDPEAALQAALKAQPLAGFTGGSMAVIESVLQRDLKLGGKMLQRLPDFSNHFTFPPALYQLSPSGLIQAVVSPNQKPNETLARALREPLRLWSAKDPKALTAWLKSLPPHVSGPLLPHVMQGLGANDPTVAKELIAAEPNAALREAAASQLVRGWVTKDPGAAFTYACNQLGASRQDTLKKIARTLAESQPDQIPALVAQLPAGPRRVEALQVLGNEWLDQDPPSASQWLSTLPAGPDRADALNAVAKRWAENAPEAAMDFFRQAADRDLNSVYEAIVARHAGDDAHSAVRQVLEQLPERQVLGIREAFNSMSTNYHLEDATELLNALPTAELQQEAVRSFLEPFGTGTRLFDEGLKWAAALPNGPLRQTATEILAQSPQLTPEERAKADAALR